MQKRLGLLILLGLLISSASSSVAFADDEAPPPEPKHAKTIGLDGGLAMPTGDWGDGASVGFGALARLEVPLVPKLTLTGRIGYIQHLGKDGPNGGSASASEIPLLGGVRYAFAQKPTNEFYGAAELGIVVARVSIDFNGQSMDGSDTNLGMSLGGGYRTGKLDLRAGLLFPDIGHLGSLGLMATVGYDLTAL